MVYYDKSTPSSQSRLDNTQDLCYSRGAANGKTVLEVSANPYRLHPMPVHVGGTSNGIIKHPLIQVGVLIFLQLFQRLIPRIRQNRTFFRRFYSFFAEYQKIHTTL